MQKKPIIEQMTRVVSLLKSTALKLWAMTDQEFSPRDMRRALGFLALLLGVLVFVRGIDQPKSAFWDESYYVTAAERYVRDQAQYASHPPLGFMLMDLGISLSGSNKGLDTSELAATKKLDDKTKLTKGYDFTGIRLLAGWFSAISSLIVFLIFVKLLREPFEALLFSLLFIFDNGLVVQFRAAHLDPYQMTFALGAVYVWLFTFGRAPKRPLITYGVFGALCALSFMVKVNSLLILGLAGLSLGRGLWEARREILGNHKILLRLFSHGLSAGLSFIVVVCLVFSLHIVLNPNPPIAGSSPDTSYRLYMPQAYQDYLDKKRPLSPEVILEGSKGYYDYMKNDFTGIIMTEANGSNPLRWPFMHRIINYRWDFDGRKTAYVQMVANPINWGIAFFASLTALFLIIANRCKMVKFEAKEDFNRLEALMIMYLFYWGFHIWLGTQRVMYVYHYFIGLVLVYFMAGLCFKIIMNRFKPNPNLRQNMLLGMAGLIGASFLFYSPLTYHTKLTREECEWRNIPFKAVVCQPRKKE